MLVKFFATFRKITQAKEVIVDGAATVKELLELLVVRYEQQPDQNFLLQDGKLHPDVILLVNGRAVEHLQGIETKLATDDVVAIFPRIAGG